MMKTHSLSFSSISHLCKLGNLQGQTNPICISHKFNPQEDSGSGFPIEPPRLNRPNGYSHCSSMIHPSVTESSLTSKGSSRKHQAELKTQKSLMPHATADFSNTSLKKDDEGAPKELVQVKPLLHFLLNHLHS